MLLELGYEYYYQVRVSECVSKCQNFWTLISKMSRYVSKISGAGNILNTYWRCRVCQIDYSQKKLVWSDTDSYINKTNLCNKKPKWVGLDSGVCSLLRSQVQNLSGAITSYWEVYMGICLGFNWAPASRQCRSGISSSRLVEVRVGWFVHVW